MATQFKPRLGKLKIWDEDGRPLASEKDIDKKRVFKLFDGVFKKLE